MRACLWVQEAESEGPECDANQTQLPPESWSLLFGTTAIETSFPTLAGSREPPPLLA